jgi:hypothetical protein
LVKVLEISKFANKSDGWWVRTAEGWKCSESKEGWRREEGGDLRKEREGKERVVI